MQPLAASTDHLLPDLLPNLVSQIAARADSADRTGKLPSEDVQSLTQSGFTSLSVPREYGGYGYPLRDCIAALLEISQASASTAMVAAMNMHVFGTANERRHWPEAHFEQLCRASVHEGALCNSIASEPQLGSPSRGKFFATFAEDQGDGYLAINGHKNWCTGGEALTHLILKLSLGEDSAVVLVPGHTPGLEWVETWNGALSLRASNSHDLLLKDVRVPVENVLENGGGSEPPNGWFVMCISVVYLGAALAARDAAIKYALERVPTALGKPIATLPKIQRQIGEIDLPLQAARTLVMDACAQWSGTLDPERRKAEFVRIVAAKTFAIEVAAQVSFKALQIAGGNAISRDLPFERYFRDSQPGFSHPPSGDTAYEMVGKEALNGYRSSAPNGG